MDIVLIVILVVIVLAVLYGIIAYNGLVSLQNRSEEAWADIDVQLKRRYDLIPNLVDTVKGYAEHEQETFRQVTEARTAAMQAGTIKEQEGAENMLSSALKSLFAVSEDYPDLKASENFKELQRELTDTENKIQAARRFYNSNVRDLNIQIEQFPSNIIAGMFNFTQREFFELEEESGARENVDVGF